MFFDPPNRLAAFFPVEADLPPLQVEIHSPNEPPRIVELPDPRAAYCAAMGRQGAKFGVTARPVVTSDADAKLVNGASGIKIELLRFPDDEGALDAAISFEIRGELGPDDSELLGKLLAQFRLSAGGEGTVGHE